MDIEQLKKYAKNKIEADNLTKQVRQRIKETIWEKQNQREEFSETFQPLISQFEKPEDPKTKNIFTQNQEMLRNHLALTEGLRDNQKAITQGFSQFERLADMKELPGVEAIEEDQEDKEDLVNLLDQEDEAQAQAQAPIQPQAPIAKFSVEDFDNDLNEHSRDTLKSIGYENLPSFYFDKDVSELASLINDVNSDLGVYGKKLKNTASFSYTKEGYILAEPKFKNPYDKTIERINNYNALSIYSTNLNLILKYKSKIGSGIFYSNPEELLKRFELLNGSLAAGNNGVLPEYIEIAHRFRDLGIITSNQLNKLLKKVI